MVIYLGFDLYDSFQDVLLTTDDRLLRKAIKYSKLSQVKLDNLVTWLMETLLLQGDENNDTN
ncbi:MAG: hypothetical protein GPJ09_21610 [Microcystis aeruginosa SX13-01]|nr:hypothetical protein [Microcystis aeruginosa SX13-01]